MVDEEALEDSSPHAASPAIPAFGVVRWLIVLLVALMAAIGVFVLTERAMASPGVAEANLEA